ncbi:probable WRKY transcription factor 34 isoform X3 [Triticum urartu]|nr:probable WRKY transcription factor 34 isoform X3 [Triticum urartu]XP_048557919.1 probable WRKY transcription factor 34 isoform X3 [Triticum urartu]XP_048557920.1 probable WRKY transcription factor 34 isoform X3 [Triticum urartu]
MDGHTHLAMEWKDQSPGADCSMLPSFLTDPFPADPLVEDCDGGNDGSEGAGFERHGLSVAVGSPQEEGKPATPHFGQRSSSSSSLSERMQARAGFSVAKLSMPGSEYSGAQSPYLTIPPGLSPASLLESPVFLSNAMGQSSPTTGKLLMLGDTNSNNNTRLEPPSIEDRPGAFSFKPLDLKSSQYTAEGKKGSLPNSQHPSAPSRDVPVKTETNIQTTTRGAIPPGHLNQAQFNNGQDLMKCSYHDCNNKRNRLAADSTTAGGDNNDGPPATAADSEAAKGDYPAAVATAAPAEDGYSWRKYGQKQVKHSEYPRSYYKCTHPSCQVKKKVERSHEGHVTEIIYKGTHNHPRPAAQGRRPAGGAQVHPFNDAQMDAPADNNNNGYGNAGGSQPNAEARSLWHAGVAVQDWRGDGLEATSSPSVPGELCDSSASMQVHDGAARFESPEGGVDVTSAVSDEVDGDDRVAHGSMSQGQGAADTTEGDELESKRRKLESCAIDMSTASRAVREPRVVIQTTSEVDILDDGYRWRKYGQKVVKGNPNPRSYYKCTHPGCSVRKHVERASHDLKSVITTYEGKHNHEVPAARNGGHGSSAVSGGTGASQLSHARRAEPPSVQDGLMRLGGCGAPFGLPPRDPLGPMSNYPYSLGGGHASRPSLPMPSGLGAVEGLKLPMLSPSLHSVFRQRQAMETAAGFRVPKGEVKDEAAGAGAGAGAGGGAAAAAAYPQTMMSRLPLGHRM